MLAPEQLPNVSGNTLRSQAQSLNQPYTRQKCPFDNPGVSQGGNSHRFCGVNAQMQRLHTISFSSKMVRAVDKYPLKALRMAFS